MPESELQALLSISQIDLRRDFNQLLDEILAIVTNEVGGNAGTMMLVNEETGKLEMVAAFGLGGDYIDRIYARGVPITSSPSGEVLKTGKYYEVPNIFDEPRDKWWADIGRKLGFSAQLFMPMKREDEVIGLLNIYMEEPYHYTDNEITFVSIAASQAATVIEKVRLYQQALEKRKELENEIKARKKTEETLEENKRLLNKIFALSPLGIGLVDFNPGGLNDRTLSWTNEAMMALFGFKPDETEYLGQSAEVLYASREEFERVGELFREKLKTGELAEVDAKLKRRDGSTFDGYITTSFIDPSKPQKGLIATISDITWRKQAEEQLKQSEEKFRTFMETARDLMHILDKDGNFTYVNGSRAMTLGYSKEELLGMHITQILTKKSLSEDFESRWNTIVTKGELTLDAVWVTKDGKEIHGELKVVAIYDEDGTFAGGRAVFHDITERKKAEDALRASEEQYRSLIETAGAGVVTINMEGEFTLVNDALCGMIGYSNEELLGSFFADYIHPDDRAKIQDLFLNALKGPRTNIPTFRLSRDSQRWAHALVAFQPYSSCL
jgi:PAS domain S-box-containing protein